MRARPRFNKDEVDEDDDDDDAIRCKVKVALGETDDDFRNKTRAMADIYSYNSCNKFCRRLNSALVELRKRERGKMHLHFFTLLSAAFACLSNSISITIIINH